MNNTFFIQFILIPYLCALLCATSAAPLGAILTWRRLIYFGEALAHGAWLGIALALFLSLPIYLGIWLTTALLIFLLYTIKHYTKLDGNNILGSLSHFLLALGVILLSKMEGIRTDLFSYLFGDILNTSSQDLILILILCISSLIGIKILWQALLMLTINEEIARSENKHIYRYEIAFLILLGLYTGIMIQFFGLMLVIAFLIIPIQTASRLSKTPEQCVKYASLLVILCTTIGFIIAYIFDFPVSPSIVAITGIAYLISQIKR